MLAAVKAGRYIMPVSYTHLDVYKRQYLNRSDPPAGIADSSLACYSEGEFNDDQPDVACQVEFTGQTALYDYQDQEGRAGAIQLAAGPGLEGVDEAATLTAGEDGFVEATLTQCTPVSYKTCLLYTSPCSSRRGARLSFGH